MAACGPDRGRRAFSRRRRPRLGAADTTRQPDRSRHRQLDRAGACRATVVVEGPEGKRGEPAGADGVYTVSGLAPGAYVVAVYYSNAWAEGRKVAVAANKTVQLDVAVPVQEAARRSPYVHATDEKRRRAEASVREFVKELRVM